MSTGMIDSWAGEIAEIGPMYPFVGSEGFLVLLGIALWLVWHVLQSRTENRIYEEELARFGSDAGLRDALDLEAGDTSENK